MYIKYACTYDTGTVRSAGGQYVLCRTYSTVHIVHTVCLMYSCTTYVRIAEEAEISLSYVHTVLIRKLCTYRTVRYRSSDRSARVAVPYGTVLVRYVVQEKGPTLSKKARQYGELYVVYRLLKVGPDPRNTSS